MKKFTITKKDLRNVSAIDLAAEIENANEDTGPAELYRVEFEGETIAAEVLYFPEINRGAIAWGSDAQWTDAIGARNVAERFLTDNMSA